MNLLSRRLFLAVFMLLFWQVMETQSAAGHPAQNEPEFKVRSESNLVVLDVVVRDSSGPVTGLSKELFQVFENNHPQQIESFEEHTSADRSSRPSQKLPPNTFTNKFIPELPVNVLLLDALNTPVPDQQALRQKMIEYLKTVPESVPFAIFTLSSRLRLVQPVTADTAMLLKALEAGPGRSSSPLLEDANDSVSVANDTAMDVLQDFQNEIAAVQTDLRVQITLDAMKQLAGYLDAFPGRKNLIWLSGSFPLSLAPDDTSTNPLLSQRTYSSQMHEISQKLAACRISVYPIDVRGLLPESLFSATNSNSSYAASSPRSGRRNNGPAGFTRSHIQSSTQGIAEHDTMQQIAEESGGIAFFNTNGLKEAMAKAVDDAAHYYTLTYRPDNGKSDGHFRKIKVKVGDDHYHLSYRHGYFAKTVHQTGSEAASSFISPDSVLIQHGAPGSSQVLFMTRVLAEGDPALSGVHLQPGPAGLMTAKLHGPLKRQSIDYNVDMRTLVTKLEADNKYHAALELLEIAYSPAGTPLNIANQAFRINLQPSEYETVQKTGLRLHQEIDLPVEELYLRLVVHDLQADTVGSIELRLKPRQ